jgi:hypothetical protein
VPIGVSVKSGAVQSDPIDLHGVTEDSSCTDTHPVITARTTKNTIFHNGDCLTITDLIERMDITLRPLHTASFDQSILLRHSPKTVNKTRYMTEYNRNEWVINGGGCLLRTPLHSNSLLNRELEFPVMYINNFDPGINYAGWSAL